MIRRKTYIKRSSKPIKRSAPIKKGKPVKRPKGYDDPEYRAWLKSWPCIVCILNMLRCGGLLSIDSRHRELYKHFSCQWPTADKKCLQVDVAHVGLRGVGQKCNDREAIPLGTCHHRHVTCPGGGPESHHTLGKKFWAFHGIDRKEVIEMLNRMYHEETGR